jgi:hypothetical protein
MLIRGEQIMWSTGERTNWDPGSLPTVRLRYRVLGLALRALRELAKPTRVKRGNAPKRRGGK